MRPEPPRQMAGDGSVEREEPRGIYNDSRVCVFVYAYEEDRDKYKTEIKMGIVAQIEILSRLFCWVHGKCLANKNKNWIKTIAS